jgi:hypothetical protein
MHGPEVCKLPIHSFLRSLHSCLSASHLNLHPHSLLSRPVPTWKLSKRRQSAPLLCCAISNRLCARRGAPACFCASDFPSLVASLQPLGWFLFDPSCFRVTLAALSSQAKQVRVISLSLAHPRGHRKQPFLNCQQAQASTPQAPHPHPAAYCTPQLLRSASPPLIRLPAARQLHRSLSCQPSPLVVDASTAAIPILAIPQLAHRRKQLNPRRCLSRSSGAAAVAAAASTIHGSHYSTPSHTVR